MHFYFTNQHNNSSTSKKLYNRNLNSNELTLFDK